MSYPTAWLLHRKINNATARQEATCRLKGIVLLDDAYLGGKRTGGKGGRGSENKMRFVAAAWLNDAGQPLYAKLGLARGFTLGVHWQLGQGPAVSGHRHHRRLSCSIAVTEAGCIHIPRVFGAFRPRELPEFKWVNNILGNLKTMLVGTFQALKYLKYAQVYLAAFTYRFNRSFDLRGLAERLIDDVARTPPMKKMVARGNHAKARF